MTDYHQGVKFSVRVPAKVLEDFSYLPGDSQRDRFERVVALGLRMAGTEPVKPASAAPVDDRRARIDAALAGSGNQQPAPARAEITVEDILQQMRSLGRAEIVQIAKAAKRRIADEGWPVSF